MAIEFGDSMSRNSALSRAQMEQVASRVSAPAGQVLVFSRDGVILHTDAEQRVTLALHDEVYSVRQVGGGIEFERIASNAPQPACDAIWA